MNIQELLDIVDQKAMEEWKSIKGRQGWEHGFIRSQWFDRLKWVLEPPTGWPVANMPHEYTSDGTYGCRVCGQKYHCANCRTGSSMMGHYFGEGFRCEHAYPRPGYGDG
jgi:hypothetical protein